MKEGEVIMTLSKVVAIILSTLPFEALFLLGMTDVWVGISVLTESIDIVILDWQDGDTENIEGRLFLNSQKAREGQGFLLTLSVERTVVNFVFGSEIFKVNVYFITDWIDEAVQEMKVVI